MSIRALTWAVEDPRAGNLSNAALRVLWVLADHAHDDGTAAWASATTLADRLGVSERTIERAVATLRDVGLIRRGDQSLITRGPTNRRPVVWDLDLQKAPRKQSLSVKSGPTDLSALDESGPTPDAIRADTESTPGPTSGVGENPPEPSTNHPAAHDASSSLTVSDEDAHPLCRQCWCQHHPNARCTLATPAPAGWKAAALRGPARLSMPPALLAGPAYPDDLH